MIMKKAIGVAALLMLLTACKNESDGGMGTTGESDADLTSPTPALTNETNDATGAVPGTTAGGAGDNTGAPQAQPQGNNPGNN